MAITESGPGGHHRGKLGNMVYYTLNGKRVVREIGRTLKPPTEKQLASRMITKMSSALLKHLLDFIQAGFSQQAIKTQNNAFNEAVKANKKNIIKGIYPYLEIAYDQLLLSVGTLKPAQYWHVEQVAHGLQYSWATDPQMAWPEATDQVMMLAYFPKQEKVHFTLFGKDRLAGSDLLEIPPSLQGEYMETYMSFIAADRKQVSNSTYTGSFNAETTEN
ncbi:DUF6266 family protein [Pedobacter africanus]|uniref:Uncharacterized protein n=1 Tax=Pedobacter africanus TaxID=151894 RepID=A0A1W2DIA1_9SPHI|nr:DUF6266 family protein [Pedobacter africanus]SMC97145.1 hypothetical protein SAMN04488524_3848 [Pedobacter africanus]